MITKKQLTFVVLSVTLSTGLMCAQDIATPINNIETQPAALPASNQQQTAPATPEKTSPEVIIAPSATDTVAAAEQTAKTAPNTDIQSTTPAQQETISTATAATEEQCVNDASEQDNSETTDSDYDYDDYTYQDDAGEIISDKDQALEDLQDAAIVTPSGKILFVLARVSISADSDEKKWVLVTPEEVTQDMDWILVEHSNISLPTDGNFSNQWVVVAQSSGIFTTV